MLLVLLSLAVATILAIGYLASRDNSAMIGQNVAASTAGRWAALSALRTTIAILETGIDWGDVSEGEVLDEYPLADAVVNVDAVDQITGGHPTAVTEYVELTASARTANVEQHVTAWAYAPRFHPLETVAAVDLAEFAAFAESSITFQDEATLARWPHAPLARLGQRVVIATQSLSASAVQVLGNAAAIDTTVYHDAAASPLLVNNQSPLPIQSVGVGGQIPLPLPPVTIALVPSGPSVTISNSVTWSGIHECRDLRVRTGAGHLVLQNGTVVATERDLRVDSGARILVQGTVEIAVTDDLILDVGDIELDEGASLSLYVGGTIDVRNSYIGEERADDSRDHTGGAPYMDPVRVRLYSLHEFADGLPGGPGGPQVGTGKQWRVWENSVVKASIYATEANFQIANDSALYGRVAAMSVDVQDNGAIFYDPGLDERRGYRNPACAMYDAAGAIRPAFQLLASLGADDLNALATVSGATIRAGGTTYLQPLPLPPPPGEEPPPVPVEYTILTFGMPTAEW